MTCINSQQDEEITVQTEWNEIDDRSFATCHRCRRDRDYMSCLGCPKYNLRGLREALEEGTIAAVAALLATILAVYLYGVAS